MHDLNKDPSLPFPEATFDAVICAVSIDYMKRPREVLAEVCSQKQSTFPVKGLSEYPNSLILFDFILHRYREC